MFFYRRKKKRLEGQTRGHYLQIERQKRKKRQKRRRNNCATHSPYSLPDFRSLGGKRGGQDGGREYAVKKEKQEGGGRDETDEEEDEKCGGGEKQQEKKVNKVEIQKQKSIKKGGKKIPQREEYGEKKTETKIKITKAGAWVLHHQTFQQTRDHEREQPVKQTDQTESVCVCWLLNVPATG